MPLDAARRGTAAPEAHLCGLDDTRSTGRAAGRVATLSAHAHDMARAGTGLRADAREDLEHLKRARRSGVVLQLRVRGCGGRSRTILAAKAAGDGGSASRPPLGSRRLGRAPCAVARRRGMRGPSRRTLCTLGQASSSPNTKSLSLAHASATTAPTRRVAHSAGRNTSRVCARCTRKGAAGAAQSPVNVACDSPGGVLRELLGRTGGGVAATCARKLLDVLAHHGELLLRPGRARAAVRPRRMARACKSVRGRGPAGGWRREFIREPPRAGTLPCAHCPPSPAARAPAAWAAGGSAAQKKRKCKACALCLCVC